MDKLDKAYYKIKPVLAKVLSTTAFFIVVFLGAWYSNGTGVTKFDLSALQSFYLVVAGVGVAGHGINSIYNSPRGQAPGAAAQEREEK